MRTGKSEDAGLYQNCPCFSWKAGDTNPWIAKKPQILESPNVVKGPGFHERERARGTKCEAKKVKVLVSFSLITDLDFVERPLC